MSENNIILVPLHPPHFHWVINLLNSASEKENIGLIFSSEEEASQFSHHFPYKPIIADPFNDDNKFSFITHKKLNALKKVYKDYDYVAIIDSESKFIRETTPYLKDIWDRNCFVANHSVDGSRMIRKLANKLGYELNDNLYAWFNEIPIYNSLLCDGFFSWLERQSKSTLNDAETFDFMLFAMYCRFELNIPWRVLGADHEIVWHGLTENPSWKNFRHLINEVSWSTWFPGVEGNPNIKIIFHLDRYPEGSV